MNVTLQQIIMSTTLSTQNFNVLRRLSPTDKSKIAQFFPENK